MKIDKKNIKIRCPDCGSAHIVKAGFQITVSEGKKQRRKCQDCGRVFYWFLDFVE